MEQEKKENGCFIFYFYFFFNKNWADVRPQELQRMQQEPRSNPASLSCQWSVAKICSNTVGYGSVGDSGRATGGMGQSFIEVVPKLCFWDPHGWNGENEYQVAALVPGFSTTTSC